jgi:hypothetical protein
VTLPLTTEPESELRQTTSVMLVITLGFRMTIDAQSNPFRAVPGDRRTIGNGNGHDTVTTLAPSLGERCSTNQPIRRVLLEHHIALKKKLDATAPVIGRDRGRPAAASPIPAKSTPP